MQVVNGCVLIEFVDVNKIRSVSVNESGESYTVSPAGCQVVNVKVVFTFNCFLCPF